MTPAHVNALDRRRKLALKDTRQMSEFLFAQLTQAVYNTGFRSTKEPTKVTDFMPSEWGKVTKREPKKGKVRWTKKMRHKMFLDLRTALGGS